MSDLPDDLWRRILLTGVTKSILSFKDLCSLSITCKRFHQLSGEDSLWSPLTYFYFSTLEPQFCNPFWWGPRDECRLSHHRELRQPDFVLSFSAKSRYKFRLERYRERERIKGEILEELQRKRSAVPVRPVQRGRVVHEQAHLIDIVMEVLE